MIEYEFGCVPKEVYDALDGLRVNFKLDMVKKSVKIGTVLLKDTTQCLTFTEKLNVLKK